MFKIIQKHDCFFDEICLLCGIFSHKIKFNMKQIITKYGLISGAISAVMLLSVTLIFKYIGFDKVGFDNSAYIGYGSMLISMSVVFFAIRTYRDQQNDGLITFGKGLLIGLGITAIACVVYSLTWLVIYYNFIPTFMDDYAAYCVQKAEATGTSKAELTKTLADINQMKEWYKNPFLIFAFTLLEPLPVGLLISLVSAGVLRKK